MGAAGPGVRRQWGANGVWTVGISGRQKWQGLSLGVTEGARSGVKGVRGEALGLEYGSQWAVGAEGLECGSHGAVGATGSSVESVEVGVSSRVRSAGFCGLYGQRKLG